MPTWNASLQAVVFLFMAISLQSDSIEILKYSDKASMSYNFYQYQVQKLYCQKNVKSKKDKINGISQQIRQLVHSAPRSVYVTGVATQSNEGT